MTFDELLEHVAEHYDEVTIMEALEITAEGPLTQWVDIDNTLGHHTLRESNPTSKQLL